MKTKMKTKVILLLILILSIEILSACGQEGKRAGKEDRKTESREITVATNSESGGLDPSGMIAITYLAYSVTSLDELLTFDSNGAIE